VRHQVRLLLAGWDDNCSDWKGVEVVRPQDSVSPAVQAAPFPKSFLCKSAVQVTGFEPVPAQVGCFYS